MRRVLCLYTLRKLSKITLSQRIKANMPPIKELGCQSNIDQNQEDLDTSD